MKQLLVFALILLVPTLFIACEKEPETDIEIIEIQLKDFVEDNGITKCSVVVLFGHTAYTEHEGAEFSIANGFVIINASANGGEYQDRYNLLYLSKYSLGADKYLSLYFAGTHF